jgi:hypothetical protein
MRPAQAAPRGERVCGRDVESTGWCGEASPWLQSASNFAGALVSRAQDPFTRSARPLFQGLCSELRRPSV